MPLRSMTGFARSHGSLGAVAWDWEVRTVNGKGLVTAVTDPLSHATSLAYDTYGNRTTVTNANSKVWTYAYDSKGRVTSVTMRFRIRDLASRP